MDAYLLPQLRHVNVNCCEDDHLLVFVFIRYSLYIYYISKYIHLCVYVALDLIPINEDTNRIYPTNSSNSKLYRNIEVLPYLISSNCDSSPNVSQ